MENTIKIIAIGKGGYEEGAVEQMIISFEDLDKMSFPETIVMSMIEILRNKVAAPQTINAKLKNKKK